MSVLGHLGLFALSLLTAFALAFNFRNTDGWFQRLYLPLLPISVLIKLVVFGWMRHYRGSWRYVGLRDLISVAIASQISALVFILLFFATEYVHAALGRGMLFEGFPQSVFLLDWAGTIALVAAARITVRLYHEEYRAHPGESVTRTLIIGAGDAGEALLREILRMPEGRYLVVGFVEDDPAKLGARIHGVEVLGKTDQIKQLCDRYDVEEILIAIPTATHREFRRVVELCTGTNLRLRTVPGVSDVMEGKVKVSQIRDVDIEDLLGREAVTLDLEAIGRYLRDKRVMVTGAGGSIGSEMCRQIAPFRPERLILVERAENNLFEIDRELRLQHGSLDIVPYVADISDSPRIEVIFAAERPHAVFHAAAHKHVPMMELNPGESIKNNVSGSKIVSDAAAAHGVEKFVMISSDKAVNPTSVMGCSKRVAEMYVQGLSARSSTQFVTVRFGNVLGSSGSVVPIFREQISRGGPVTVTHPDMMRYFMTIPEAAQLVLQAGAMGRGGEIYVLRMGEPVKIIDLARDLITLSGLRPGEDVDIVFTGVRPGEKLIEELLIDGEDVSGTSHPKIGIWQGRTEDWDALRRGMERLTELSDAGDLHQVRQALKTVVPEYAPADSGPGVPGAGSASTAADAGHAASAPTELIEPHTSSGS